MRARHTLLILGLFVVGCGPAEETNNGSATGTSAVPGSSAGDSSLQTVEGDGFSFAAPADWTVLRAGKGVGVASPLDIEKEIPPVPVSFTLSPVPAPAKSADIAATLIQTDKVSGDIESESQITVAGYQATKLVSTDTMRRNDTSDDVLVSRSIKVFVPLDAGVLIVQVQGEDQYVVPLIPTIDAIIESIRVK